jgi:hypothetical protein
MARTAEPYPAAFRQMESQVTPGDEIVVRLWGLTGWSMNWWLVTTELFAVVLVVPFMLGLRHLYTADISLCGSVGVLLSASWWTRAALLISITSQGQLLCCRISRPFQRKTISSAPLETAWFGDFRRGRLFSQLRYRGPGTNGKTVRLNIPAGCRRAAETLTGPAPRMATN